VLYSKHHLDNALAGNLNLCRITEIIVDSVVLYLITSRRKRKGIHPRRKGKQRPTKVCGFLFSIILFFLV
jgi:hypothetical protein